MIETIMYVALGFLLANLLALLLAPPLWRRAVRLTTRKLEATMPMSLADIQADKDQLRAEFAIKYRQQEIALDDAKDKAARVLVERNLAQTRIDELTAELKAQAATLAERDSQITVLEQTVKRKIPDLEAQLGRAREIIMSRDQEIQKLKSSQAPRLRGAPPAGRGQPTPAAGRKRARGRGARTVSAEDAATLLADNQRLSAELARLEQASAQEKEALRSEMRQLADQILRSARPAAQSSTAPQDPRPAAAPQIGAEAGTGTPQRGRASATKPAAAPGRPKRERKGRRSLTDRLKSLASTDGR